MASSGGSEKADKMAEFVPLEQLVHALREGARSNWSGAFFITSPDQHSALITMHAGQITAVKFRTIKGNEAAETIAQFDRVRFQSGQGPTELPGSHGVDTRTVLEILAGGVASPQEGQERPPAQPTREDAGAAADTPGERALEQLRERYIGAIGPVGGALFDEAIEAMGDSVYERAGYARLVEQLAGQIDDEAEARRFREDARLT